MEWEWWAEMSESKLIVLPVDGTQTTEAALIRNAGIAGEERVVLVSLRTEE